LRRIEKSGCGNQESGTKWAPHLCIIGSAMEGPKSAGRRNKLFTNKKKMSELSLHLLTTKEDCDKYKAKLVTEKSDLELKIANMGKSSTTSSGNTKEKKEEVTAIDSQIVAYQSIIPTLTMGTPKRNDAVIELSALNHRRLILTTDLEENGPFKVLDKELNLQMAISDLQIVNDTIPKVDARNAELP